MDTKRIALVLIGLVVLGGSDVARAESRAAKAHYDKGVMLYNLGHFTESITEFEQAYQIDSAPILLYNIAQAHRQLGNNERAAFFYRRYIEAAPDAPNRADVEKRMHELEELVKKQGDAKQRPPTEVEPLSRGTGSTVTELPPTETSGGGGAQPATTRPATTSTTGSSNGPTTVTAAGGATDRGRTLRIAGVATAAVGGASVVVGAVFGSMASSKGNSVGSAGMFNPDDDSAGRRDATLQWVFYGVGAAAVIGGAALYYLGWRADSADARVALFPSLQPGAAGASLRLRF